VAVTAGVTVTSHAVPSKPGLLRRLTRLFTRH
jgi:hypothetical protein